ncbi:MAG: hypothetical protein M3383_01820 [Actinomycetota bacterium]|nr:hypothetical protein [Actinomycetota bacterium]
MTEPASDADRVAALETFALTTLPSMRRDDGAFCQEVALPDLRPTGRSLRYTLICLLGLQRAQAAGLAVSVDPGELRQLILDEIDSSQITAGDLGLLLWADAREDSPEIDRIASRLWGRLGTDIPDLEGLELSWCVIGAALAGAGELLELTLAAQLRRAKTPSGLIAHRDRGRRARFPNFATQIYGVLALAGAGPDEALGAAQRTADTLLELQRPDGGWPWICDTQTGRVVEAYEVYSVHQDAMAPMALLDLSERTGDDRYRDAALRGMRWIFEGNELRVPMLDEEKGIVYRSIRRRKPFDRAALYANTAVAQAFGRVAVPRARASLELNPTDRPYHLGWVLEAWAGREPG